MSGEASRPAQHNRPARFGAQGPFRLQLRCLLQDAGAVERTAALLARVAPCEVLRLPLACRVSDRRGSGFDDGEEPSAVILLVDAEYLRECGKTLARTRAAWPCRPVLVLASDLDAAALVAMLACGAFDFAWLGSTDAEIELRVRRALGCLPVAPPDEADAIVDDPAFRELQARLIGRAPHFTRLLRRVPTMAACDACMLLMGETGTGKEICAQAIHYLSPRASRPWVPINCAAIPAELVEDELFGHVRGAYTHAVNARQGLVHEAEGGTLFLDEIDSMPPAAQAKLLRFLQDKQYRVIGSSAVRTADVRIIAASNRDLRSAAARGSFRQDLFFRLNVLNITLPPLRDRSEDIPLLAAHFIAQACRESGRHLLALTPAATHRLVEYDWPGNVRELKHVMQRAVLLAQGQALQTDDIEIDDNLPRSVEPLSFREAKERAVEAFERSFLERMLAQNEGNITRAARAAKKDRRAFFELMRRRDIDAATYRGLPR